MCAMNLYEKQFPMIEEPEIPIREEKPPSPMTKDIMKMLKAMNMECEDPEVIASLTSLAENMAVALLKQSAYYSDKKLVDPDKCLDDDEYKAQTQDVCIEKEDIELAIEMNKQNEVKLPNEDALIDLAVAVNDHPLVVREKFGIPLPKDNLGNCNYQLHNQSKKMKLDAERQARPYYACILPYKGYNASQHPNANNYNMYKQPMRVRNANTNEPMRITIMPRYGMMAPMYGQSMLRQHFEQRTYTQFERKPNGGREDRSHKWTGQHR